MLSSPRYSFSEEERRKEGKRGKKRKTATVTELPCPGAHQMVSKYFSLPPLLHAVSSEGGGGEKRKKKKKKGRKKGVVAKILAFERFLEN